MFRARPRRMLATAVALSALLTGASVLGYWALGPEVQARFTVWQLATLAVIVGVLDAAMLGAGLSYVRADSTGLTFRNGARARHLPWEAVKEVRFRSGDPWAYVELDVEFSSDEHERRPLLGIQASEGQLAVRQAAELRRLVHEFKGRTRL